jgi:hypothetical protein
MMLCLSLSRLLGGSLESKEAGELLKRMSGLGLFTGCLFLGLRIAVVLLTFLDFWKITAPYL